MLKIAVFIFTGMTPIFSIAGTLCPNAVGAALLHAAWVSPEFISCSFDSIKNLENGNREIIFKIVGRSRLSKLPDKEVWVKGSAIMTNNWHPTSIRWAEHKSLVPPGAATGAIGKYLSHYTSNSR